MVGFVVIEPNDAANAVLAIASPPPCNLKVWLPLSNLAGIA
jgi:hypothetical protein